MAEARKGKAGAGKGKRAAEANTPTIEGLDGQKKQALDFALQQIHKKTSRHEHPDVRNAAKKAMQDRSGLTGQQANFSASWSPGFVPNTDAGDSGEVLIIRKKQF